MIHPGKKLCNWGSRRPPPNYHSIASATAGSHNYIVYSYMEFERKDAMGRKGETCGCGWDCLMRDFPPAYLVWFDTLMLV
jgi:hypothetical protein